MQLKNEKTFFFLMLLLLVPACRVLESQYFENRFASADAVLRIKVVEEYGGSSYHFVKAKVIKVFKSQKTQPIDSEIGIAYLGSGNGLPVGKECTVYLKASIDADKKVYWKLDESELNASDSYSGFSHSSTSE